MSLLAQHDWPGNIRELQSAIKYCLVQAAGEVITPDCLPESIRVPPCRSAPPEAETATLDAGRLVESLLRAGEGDIYRKVFVAVERVLLDTVLLHVKGNQVQASELLGISRTTLRAKMRSLGMAIEKHLLSEVDQDEQ